MCTNRNTQVVFLRTSVMNTIAIREYTGFFLQKRSDDFRRSLSGSPVAAAFGVVVSCKSNNNNCENVFYVFAIPVEFNSNSSDFYTLNERVR